VAAASSSLSLRLCARSPSRRARREVKYNFPKRQGGRGSFWRRTPKASSVRPSMARSRAIAKPKSPPEVSRALVVAEHEIGVVDAGRDERVKTASFLICRKASLQKAAIAADVGESGKDIGITAPPRGAIEETLHRVERTVLIEKLTGGTGVLPAGCKDGTCRTKPSKGRVRVEA